ncbi:MFS transporter [Cytobacillus depressus]|uniref:MFS transporter n=1 Tax=Cytobacillus depressus TaxID=1602942 RepID=A0A6L3VEW1_9BACI|nr:MFS transporter [Cytobacillus depressus]KAB2337691.1 MFS transporter [Cytobacillus depressus]
MAESFSTLKLNEKLSIRNGIATTVVLNICNNYFPLFAISVLGATNYQVGLISSLPQFIGMFAMLLGSLILSRLEEKKKFTAYSFLAARLFLIAMFFVIYLPIEFRSWVFVLLIGFMNLPGSFANLSWQSFIGDIIPDERRSGFFSERNRVMTIVGMISTFMIGILLQQSETSNPVPFQLLFLVAFSFGLLEFYYLMKHIEKKNDKKKVNKKFNLGLYVFKSKPFVYFLICSLFFNFGWQMAWSLFSIYQIKYAGATAFWISLFTVSNQIAQIASFKWWGRMADKHSNAKMLIFASLGMASTPILTMLSTNLVYLVIVNASSGLFLSGIVLLLFNHLLEVTNEDNRSTCISNYNILLALIAFIAPQFGVFLLEYTNMDIAMIVSGILRGSSAILFFFMFLYLKKREVYSIHENI